MKNVQLLVVLLILTGCGGQSFTSSLGENSDSGAETDAGPDHLETVADNDAGSAGGSDTVDSGAGGATGASGGSGGELGGAGSTGGIVETGGASESGGTQGSGGASTGGVKGTGGAPETGGAVGCTLVTHDNGVGQTWQDCVSNDTHSEPQADKACKASGAQNCTSLTGPCAYMVCGFTVSSENGATCVGCWGYDGAVSGLVSPAAPVGSGQSCGSVCPAQGATATWD